MADNTPSEPSTKKDQDEGNDKEKKDQQNPGTSEGKPIDDAGTQENTEKTAIDECDDKKGLGARKKDERQLIPDDFFYDVDELWSRPVKSDESLPDDLVRLYHSFGYPCRMRNNLHSLDEDRLVFAAGAYLQIIHLSVSPPEYEYLPTTGDGSIGPLAVHPSGTLFAVGEKGSNPTVNIFTKDDYRLYRILRGGTTLAYTSLCFNEKGELLATQGGDPDFMLTVWNWKQEAILLRCKSFSQEVTHVSFNRDLQGALTTSGSGHIKIWNMAATFTGLKLQGSVGRFGRTAISDIEGYIEFPDGKVLSGSDWGNMLLWDENLIKIQIGRKNGKPCHTGQIMHMMMVEGEIITSGLDGFVRSWNFEQIDMLESAEESGQVELEPMNEVLIGSGVQIYHLTQPPHIRSGGNARAGETEGGSSKGAAENDKERHMWYCQDGAGGIWHADLSFRLAAVIPKRILQFHGGAIVACAVSPLTHLVMTLGEDGTLRLYDFLQKKLLSVKQFKAKGSALVWIPLCVDHKCSTVMAGFDDGGIRRVAIAGATTTTFGRDRMDCQLKLLQALKPHDKKVTALAYSTGSKTSSITSLVTCSEDRTLFFFDVQEGDRYQPLCFVPLLHVPRHVTWSPEETTCDHLMITCDDGFVMEMLLPVAVDQTETLEFNHAALRVFQFISVKSEILHQEEQDQEEVVEKKRQEAREEQNKMMLVRGLETPSQQELRIENENAAAAAAKKAKEEEGEPWKPYIPPVPSPILQTVYLEGNSTFWLSMGEYDAGFLYECQFNQSLRPWDKGENIAMDKTPPVRSVRVEGADANPISAICFNNDGTCVFFGMQDGRVRLQFLESEFDLSAPRFSYSFGAHDVTQGAITGMNLSHDEAFLITVGADGNFFIFNLLPIEQLLEEIGSTKARVPAGEVSDKAATDLAPNQYTIEQAKQKSDHDHMVLLAERHKHERRTKIAHLRTRFRNLMEANMALPERHRLTPDEFVMDFTRADDVKEEQKKKVEEVKHQTAWDSEKDRLGYDKLHNHYRKELLTDRFCVRALNTDHIIWSYRTHRKPGRVLLSKMSKGSTAADHSSDEEVKLPVEEELAADAALRKLMGTQINDALLEGMSQRTAQLLRKVQEKRLKRAKRKITWNKFFETKPSDDYEDPADVVAIKDAFDSMGDRKLKSDKSYLVPDSYKLTMADGTRRLDVCQKRQLELQMEFNKRLLALQEEKVKTVLAIEKDTSRIHKLQDRLYYTQFTLVPPCPALTLDEMPGGRFTIDVEQKKKIRRGMVEKRYTKRPSMPATTSEAPHKESFMSKSRRKSSVIIARENYIKRKSMTHGPLESVSSTIHVSSPASKMVPDEAGELSHMQQELRDIEQIELAYEQSLLLKNIQKKQDLFDIQHRLLRHNKFHLDVLVQVGRLRVTTLQEEQLLLMECEHVEDTIQDRLDTCLEQKHEVDKTIKHLQAQAAKYGKELEEIGQQEKALFVQLDEIIGENNNFRDFLFKVFKKKVKRKNLQTKARTHDDESASDSESESSMDEDESDEDEEDAFTYDLNTCPPKCNELIFQQVIELREQRLDVDDKMSEVKRARDTVQKELEACSKKRLIAEQTFNKAQQELAAFQREKQQRVNALDVLCTLQLHQIQSLRRNGEFNSITDELCINENEVSRLQSRISELQQEKMEEKKRTVTRRKQHLRLQYERRQFMERLDAMEEKCDKEMLNKFGQKVDLEVVETVVADPQIADVRARLVCNQLQSDRELKALDKELSYLQLDNTNGLRLDSNYKLVEAGLTSSRLMLERQLDALLTKHQGYQEENPLVSQDVRDLMELVDQQREAINTLNKEIRYLHSGAPPDE